MDKLMLKVENVSKRYRYGQIGGMTLRDELARRYARLRHREDPTRIIGAGHAGGSGTAGTTGSSGTAGSAGAAGSAGKAAAVDDADTFLALDGVSFSVRRGERLGIIGHNGAGKSTLLKLISRITAPTQGDIWLDGRVASMLEVGTGFNDELTGRENIYMKGAIMGMKRKEIDAKFDDIVDFSECRPFIETPVKRYSSGMRVKLAFSVAAHLNSEIMIMDEVLAVGDMGFQRKCLAKMEEVSESEGKTILYVSHNMSTIRQLCQRCIVLDEGRLVFDGDVEKAISIYLGIEANTNNYIDLSGVKRIPGWTSPDSTVRMTALRCLGATSNVFPMGTRLELAITCQTTGPVEGAHLRIVLKDAQGQPVTMLTTGDPISLPADAKANLGFTLDTSRLAPGGYTVNPVIYEVNKAGNDIRLDLVDDVYRFEIVQVPGFNNGMAWRQRSWGSFYGDPLQLHELTDDEVSSRMGVIEEDGR